MRTSHTTTFDELEMAEPALGILLAEARAFHQQQGEVFCANAAWYGYGSHAGIKQRLLSLVGWERPDRDDFLSSMVAYDVAYETIYDALPDCRGCACLSLRIGD